MDFLAGWFAGVYHENVWGNPWCPMVKFDRSWLNLMSKQVVVIVVVVLLALLQRSPLHQCKFHWTGATLQGGRDGF